MYLCDHDLCNCLTSTRLLLTTWKNTTSTVTTIKNFTKNFLILNLHNIFQPYACQIKPKYKINWFGSGINALLGPWTDRHRFELDPVVFYWSMSCRNRLGFNPLEIPFRLHLLYLTQKCRKPLKSLKSNNSYSPSSRIVWSNRPY